MNNTELAKKAFCIAWDLPEEQRKIILECVNRLLKVGDKHE